jgi:hypothetical protein
VSGQFRQLRHEDQDRQRVDEAGHHRFRDIAHDEAQPQKPRADLDQPGQHRGRQQVLQPVIAHQRDHQHRRRGRGGRDHAGPPADEGDEHGDGEAGVEPDLGVDAGDDGKGDRLGDQRKRHDKAGQQVGADVAEPLAR